MRILCAVICGLTSIGLSTTTRADPRSTVFVRGAALNGADGLTFDGKGRLIVAEFFGAAIHAVDPRSGRIIATLAGLEKGDGIYFPDDVTLGPDGAVYYTDAAGIIGRIGDAGVEYVGFIEPDANAITFDDYGRLFVSSLWGDAIYEIDLSGATDPRLVIAGIPGPNAMDFGPDGLLYVPSFFGGFVAAVDANTGDMHVVTDGLALPTAVKFDSAGRMHVSDGGVGKIFADDGHGGLKVVAWTEAGIDNFAFNARDRIYVSNFNDGGIGRVLRNRHVKGISRSGPTVPSGIAVVPGKHGRHDVVVASWSSTWTYDGRSRRLKDIASCLFTVCETETFMDSVAADDGKLIFTSVDFGTVVVFDPSTHSVLESYEDFGLPTSALRYAGNLIVGDSVSGDVVAQDGPGNRTTLITLGLPEGIASGGGNLYVADFESGEIYQLGAEDALLEAPAVVASGLSSPQGLAVDGRGRLLIVENGAGRLTRLDLDSGERETLIDNLGLDSGATGFFPGGDFNGVAVAPSGEIYVTADADGLVYRVKDERERGHGH